MKAPTAAIWLLEHLLSGSGCDALIGDLVEQFAAGRSRAWFWRQAMVSIMVGAVRDLRANKVLIVRTAVCVLAIKFCLDFFDPRQWVFEKAFRMGTLANDIGYIGRYMYHVLSVVQMCAIGWVLGRLNRPHQGTVVLGLAIVIVLLSAPRGAQLIADVFEHPRYRSYFVDWALGTVFTPLSLVLGGALSASSMARRDTIA